MGFPILFGFLSDSAIPLIPYLTRLAAAKPASSKSSTLPALLDTCVFLAALTSARPADDPSPVPDSLAACFAAILAVNAAASFSFLFNGSPP
jgi:hypothetical protein